MQPPCKAVQKSRLTGLVRQAFSSPAVYCHRSGGRGRKQRSETLGLSSGPTTQPRRKRRRKPHLQSVHNLLLNGVLGGCVGGHPEPFGRFPQPLLLVFIVGVGSSSLGDTNRKDKSWEGSGPSQPSC